MDIQLEPNQIETKEWRLPKAELHLHLRNSMSTKLTQRLAQKNGVEIPQGRIKGNEFIWSGFKDFLYVHDVLRPIAQTPEDYAMAAENYLLWLHTKGCVYAELMISHSPIQTHIAYEDQIYGIVEGIQSAKDKCGIEARMILSGVRHSGVEHARAMVMQAKKFQHPMVTGFGLAGNEEDWPPHLFEEVYAIAVDAGLECTIHAGEWCGPEQIWQALKLPGVKRIGHGVHAIQDPKLVEHLVEKQIVLEVCPGSNVSLGVFPDYASHPFGQLFKAGVKVTLNSDDPPWFRTSLSREYRRVAETFAFSVDDMLQVTRNAIEGAFCDKDTKQRLLSNLKHFKPFDIELPDDCIDDL